MAEDPEELYRQRRERIARAVRLREPDRVPVLESHGYFAARYAGMTCYDFLFDYEKATRATVKAAMDFGYDTAGSMNQLGAMPLTLAFIGEGENLMPGWVNGPVHDILGVRYARFPGRELPKDAPFQFIGEEYVKAEEYRDFIDDPRGFLAGKLLPRSLRSLEHLGSARAMAALHAWGMECERSAKASAKLAGELRSLGFGGLTSGISYAPLDFIGDFMRDVKNVLLDCYRRPDEVKQASEVLRDLIVEMGRISARTLSPGSIQFIPLHLNEYFSPAQYREFYWPTLKEVVEELIKVGITPEVFYEGRHDAHLETILDLPKGKTISRFEKTDLVKAKEVLGDHSCIIGGPPASLFHSTPAKVDSYMKELLAEVKQGGGFMVSPAVPLAAEAKPECVKAFMNAAVRYGSY